MTKGSTAITPRVTSIIFASGPSIVIFIRSVGKLSIMPVIRVLRGVLKTVRGSKNGLSCFCIGSHNWDIYYASVHAIAILRLDSGFIITNIS